MIDVAEFRAKVHRVLEEPTYRNSAQQIAGSMLKYGGAQEAPNRIERFAPAVSAE
jgi:UDP:flavonoid glycosyltransferase YjiC (YdhE family)